MTVVLLRSTIALQVSELELGPEASLEKKLIPAVEQGKYQKGPKHLVVPGHKECLKNNGDTETILKGWPNLGQLIIKINNSNES